MGVNQEQRTIGGHTYRVRQLTALRSRKLFVRLIKAVGPALAQLVGSGNVRALLGADLGSLVPMVTEFCERLTDEELGYFCDELGGCTELVGEKESATLTTQLQDVHFAGRLLDMFKWLAFALEVNYADFLSAIKPTQAATSTGLVSAPLKFPADLTGTSGGS